MKNSFFDNFKLFKKLNQNLDIIIYLEFDSDWNHISGIAEVMLEKKKILIINSGSNKFITYLDKYPNLKVLNIDRGIFRTFIFNYLNAELVILSITDLNNSFLWKSRNVKKYVYVFHSITSTHMCYKENSFDNYDILLCVGSHQSKEIRKREEIKKLPRKKIINYFHNRIHLMTNFIKKNKINYNNNKIIICSSWGLGSIAESLDERFLINLLENKYEVFFQFHHMQLNRINKIKINYKKLIKKYSNFNFSFEYINIENLSKYVTMISDWSGAATEFAFGFKRKVIFFNLPKKIRNKNYEILKIEPLEVFIRYKIGVVLELDKIDQLNNYLKKIIREQSSENVQIYLNKIQKKYLFSKPHKDYLFDEIYN